MMREFFKQRIKRRFARRWNNLKIAAMAQRVARQSPLPSGAPVAFFKASTGIDDLSWNSGFHLLASWALRLQGIPVVYFACRSGMSHCILGTNRDQVHTPPPCRSCIYQSRTLYTGLHDVADSSPASAVAWFDFEEDRQLSTVLQNLSVPQLMCFEWEGTPLGPLCLPGLRWILRIHHLTDDADTRYLLRQYILSAWNIARKFSAFLDAVQPRLLVVFNGQFYPEATARWIAQNRGLRVITHEVGLQPASAFFTDGEATSYPIAIPDTFELTAEQNARLDVYLEKRLQGQFTMAGIQFWPHMKGLEPSFLEHISRFKQVVPIFTNVIFDTSQPHANTLFEDMFDWLDMVLEVIRAYPETLFVVRAHPDELRVRKASRETVAAWVEATGANREPNVIFIGPNEPLSSYELIEKSKFIMVYNSTIGLEASIMGAAVLCAGRARFTQYPTVFFPDSSAEVRSRMEQFLAAQHIDVPSDFRRNARRFLYYQLFRTSLPFGDYLEPSIRTTQARLRSFDLDALRPDRSPALKAVLDGILAGGDFLLKEEQHLS
jgi:hypothetical protein